MAEREVMEYDVVIVGAGPAGLAAAIRLKQLAAQHRQEIGVCVLEKGSEVGAHILSGAVIDPRALNELIPDWQRLDAPLNAPVTEDRFMFLTQSGSWKVPDWMLPACFKNHGMYIVSLGNVCRWLAKQAEALGVEIFPGFAAAEVLYRDDGAVAGIATGDMGIGRDGKPTANHQPGMALNARYTFFAEGCRGHLGRQLQDRYGLRAGADPQVYGIGLRELWEIRPDRHRQGLVIHTAGWPLAPDTYGGSFLYHLEANQVSIGFVVGLAYTNPYLSPYEEFQRYKTHPALSLSWGIPLGVSGFSFSGYMDFIAAKGRDEFGNQTAAETHFDGALMYDIGAAFGAIVNSLVNDLLMPVISLATGGDKSIVLSPEAKAILYAARNRGILEIKASHRAFESPARMLAVCVELSTSEGLIFRSRESPAYTIRFLAGFRDLCAAGLVMHHIFQEFSLTREGLELAQTIPAQEVEGLISLATVFGLYE